MRHPISLLSICAVLTGALFFSEPSAAKPISRVSVATDGTQGNQKSTNPKMSSDGRYIVFSSIASTHVANDTNGLRDIFIHDTTTGQTERVNLDSAGNQALGGSDCPDVSDDGRYVVFDSEASNLVAGDNNGMSDIFVRDRQTGTTTRVSVSSGGAEADHFSKLPEISGNGRYVTFYSLASNLVVGDTNGRPDIFRHDMTTGATELVSADAAGVIGNNAGNSAYGSISDDGRYVAFVSGASNLVPGDNNAKYDAFRKDMTTGEIIMVSVSSAGLLGNNSADTSTISADGRYVVFRSSASNLVAGDNNAQTDAFIHDTVTHQTERVSVSSAGQEGDGFSDWPRVSANGRYVAFESFSSNLVAGDTNGTYDIFLRDRTEGTTIRVSTDVNEIEGNNHSRETAMSGNARYIAFHSGSSNLVPGDTNFAYDVFVKDTGIAPAPANTVPTMTEWGMIIMASLMALSALVMRHRHQLMPRVSNR